MALSTTLTCFGSLPGELSQKLVQPKDWIFLFIRLSLSLERDGPIRKLYKKVFLSLATAIKKVNLQHEETVLMYSCARADGGT